MIESWVNIIGVFKIVIMGIREELKIIDVWIIGGN